MRPDDPRQRAGSAQPKYAVAFDSNLVMAAFMIGSAALIGLISLWVVARFSPEELRLGLWTPHIAAAGSPAPPTAQPTQMQTAAPSPLPIAVSSGAPPTFRTTRGPSASATSRQTGSAAAEMLDMPLEAIGRSSAAALSSSAHGGTTTASMTSPSPSPTPTPTPTPTNPDTLPVNAPNAAVHVSSVSFGGTPHTALTVTLQGIRPANQTTSPSQTFIEWGDGTARSISTTADNPIPAGGYTLTHGYLAEGTYSIAWGYVSDREHMWNHSIALTSSALALPAPMQSLTGMDSLGSAGHAEHFGLADPNQGPWSRWTLDYGDQTYVHGTDSRPSAADLQHSYDGTGHLATFTVVGADGQLITSTLTTP